MIARFGDIPILTVSRAMITNIIQSRFKSRLFGLHVFIAFFRKKIFDKSTAAIPCT